MKGMITTLILIVFGALCALFYVKVLKKKVFGGLVGAIIIGAVGSVIGGFILNKVILWLFVNPGWLVQNGVSVNFVAALLGSFILLWGMFMISGKEE